MDLDDSDYVGLRFNGITIPAGSTISSSYVEFTSEEDDDKASSVTIYGQGIDNAPTFTSTDDDISSRVSTTETITWSIPEWSENEVGADTQTPDIKTILQEIIDGAGWTSGNSAVLIFEEINGNNDRDAYSYDQSPNRSAKLYITFTVPVVAPSTDLQYTDIGLSLGTLYTYRVSAISNAGLGGASDPASDTTFTIPDAPTITQVNPSNTEIEIVWDAPVNNGGSEITSYKVEFKKSSDAAWSPSTSPPLDGETNVTVIGLTNGVPYEFRVSAISAVGTSVPSEIATGIPITTPGAPQNVVATRGDESALLSWGAPGSQGGSDITDYLIEYTTAALLPNWSPFSDSTSTDTEDVLVDGLTNGVDYVFRVRAVNGAGLGAYSDISNLVIPAGNPSTPGNFVATAGDKLVNLTWSVSDANGGLNLEYVVETSIDNFATLVEDPAPTTTSPTYNVLSLQNGQEYSFRITATNDVGSSAPTVIITTTPFALPDAPTGLAATGDNAAVDVTWNAPGETGGFALTEYVLEYTKGTFASVGQTDSSDTSVTSVSVSKDVTSHNVSGLDNGDEYRFRIFAVTEKGSSASSNEDTATPATIPGTPTNLSAARGVQSVVLTWNAPTNDGGDTITDYIIKSKTSDSTLFVTFDGTETTTASPTPATISITVTGLANGVSYDFEVVAVNSIGQSETPAAVSGTPFDVPKQPTILSLTLGDKQITVNWTPHADSGGDPIIDYIVQVDYNDGRGFVTFDDGVGTGTSATVPNLVNGQLFTFRVLSVNNAGSSSPSEVESGKPASPPDAPLSLNTVSKSTEIGLSWNSPGFNGGSDITSYKIEWSIDNFASILGDKTIPETTGGVTPSIFDISLTTEIESLTNGQLYYFRVFAINSIGTGDSSDVKTGTPSTTPGTPTLDEANRGDGQVELKWTPPTSSGGLAVEKYVVQVATSLDTPDWITVEDSVVGTTYTVPNLTNGVTYHFRIAAVNEIGVGSFSDSLSAVPATTPDQPLSLSTKSEITSQVTLSWVKPTFDGGKDVTDYIIEYSTDKLVWTLFPDTEDPATNTETTVTGLTNGQEYFFRVAAVNELGTGEFSNLASAIPIDLTVPPSGLVAKTISSTEISLDWIAPDITGIIGYQIERHSGDGNFAVIVITTGTATATDSTYSDTGLTSDISYTYRVSAITTSSGVGNPSGTSTTTTFGVSDSPTNLTTDGGVEQVFAFWTEPENNGGDKIASYILKWSLGNTFDSENWESMEIFGLNGNLPETIADVPGLINGQPYTFVVTATNSAGESGSSNEDTASPVTVPDPIELLSFIERGNQYVTLGWDTPLLMVVYQSRLTF
ncbi:MAG: fibronectin type III domain-containing protein [Robiginitomaculum sp.]|nr:fibronectin type III domain-containing protein [Robiginitomaculum sp.]